MPIKNLIGQKFNHLTVLKQEPSDGNGNARWLCECDCEDHTQKVVLGFALRNNTVKSCGCIKRLPGNGSTQDLSNRRFGKLVTIEPTDERSGSGSVIWRCKCDCGNIAYVPTAELNRGQKVSCGCDRAFSKGEEKIAYLLSENSINFVREYAPTDLSIGKPIDD